MYSVKNEADKSGQLKPAPVPACAFVFPSQALLFPITGKNPSYGYGIEYGKAQ
jgi:hypothetical protein